MGYLEIASRNHLLKPSPTLAINARVRQLCAEGRDVLTLAAGEPDFNTPGSICEAAKKAIDDGITKYTPTSGLSQLKEIVCQKLQRENKIDAHPDQIVISAGGKQCIYNALMALVEPGDEVIILTPCWPTYFDQVKLAGGVPVPLATNALDRFTPARDQIIEKITSKTKAIIINTPGNPTGAVWSRQVLKEIAALALKYRFWVISDEIYERLVYSNKHESLFGLGEEIAKQTVMIGGCSKTYSMTGWRLGFSVSPADLAKRFSNIQDQVSSNACSISQMAAIEAFQMPEKEIETMQMKYCARRDLMLNLIQKIPGIEVEKPEGAFYLFPKVKAFFGDTIPDDHSLVQDILEKVNVALVPGSVFFGEGHIRLSYAASPETITVALGRLSEYFNGGYQLIKNA